MLLTGRSYEATQIITRESCELQASFGAVFHFGEKQRSTKTFIKIKSKSYNRFREVNRLLHELFKLLLQHIPSKMGENGYLKCLSGYELFPEHLTAEEAASSIPFSSR